MFIKKKITLNCFILIIGFWGHSVTFYLLVPVFELDLELIKSQSITFIGKANVKATEVT